MIEDQLFIGIDSGTQGTKAILLSRTKKKIMASASAPHRIIENDEGKREQNPKWWIQACTSVINTVLNQHRKSREKVCAISIAGQQHGMVPLDAAGQVIRPAKLWCDTETASQCDKLTENIGGSNKAVDLIGNMIAVGYTASKILWMKQHEPENYNRLETILLPHDYLNFWLTGEKKTEFGDASGTAYFDIRNRIWSKPILHAIDPSNKLNNCLPGLTQSSEPIGTIRSEIAKQFRLSPNVIVASGGGDNMMGAIGTGNVSPGIVTVSLGTSGTIYAYSDHPIIDPKGELAAFCSSSGGWLPLVCTMNVTVSTELTRKLFGLNLAEFNKACSDAPLGSRGIILLPYFNGERTPTLPRAKATFFGLTNNNYNRENISRASMEGATLSLRYGLDVLKRLGIKPTEVRLIGGGAKSSFWRRMISNMFDCNVICPKSLEAGALGAALQAMWCYRVEKEADIPLKEITEQFVTLDESTRTVPLSSSVSQYAELYDRYVMINRVMKSLFDGNDSNKLL